MDDRQRAIEALEKAGYVFKPIAGLYVARTGTPVVDVQDKYFSLTGEPSALPTLLSPLTMEMVGNAVAAVRSEMTLRALTCSPNDGIAKGLCTVINGFELLLMARLRQQMNQEGAGS